MTSIRINRLLPGITTLGPGPRFGVWVQGCALACRGCASVDTWDRAGGADVDVDALARQILDAAARDALTGITITGGEPIDQASGLAALLDAIALDPLGAGLDVLVFTGYALPAARRRGAALLDRADTIIAGPYRADLPSDRPLVASSNQQVVHLTARGALRHADSAGPGHTDPRPTIQVMARGGELVLVGLPRPGDLDRLRAGLADKGVTLEGVSWAR